MTRRILLLVLPLVLALPLLAQPFEGPPGERGEGPGSRFEKVGELLELSSDQSEQWQLLVEQHRQSARAQGEELRSLREGIKALASTENPELEQLGQMTLDLHRGIESMKGQREQLETELAAILTPEQQEKFELLLDARQSLGQERKGRPGARGREGRRGGRP